MGKVKWIEYKGKRILHADYSLLSADECQKAIDEAIDIMGKLPADSELLDFADVTGTPITTDVTGKFRELGTARKRLKGATAVVGLSGFGKAVASLLNPGMKYVASVEEAKEWLVKQS